MVANRGIVVTCDWCNSPLFRLVGDFIVIEQRHHGRAHTSYLSLTALQRLAAGERDAELGQEVHFSEAIDAETLERLTTANTGGQDG